MTDQELLRLAALAGESKDVFFSDFYGFYAYYKEDEEEDGVYEWNPLNDDGDALRLAVALGLDLNLGAFGAIIYLKNGKKLKEIGDDGCDAMALCRRAIVRAAAEIGLRMEKEPS